MSLMTALSWILPHRLLSTAARSLAYSDNPRTKQWLINAAIGQFNIDLSDAAERDPNAYPTFNAFFTRALLPGAREPDPVADALVIPVDGRVGQCGVIENGRIFQAKGHAYTTTELLGDPQMAHVFQDGLFATLYLAPADYHRVHMPWTGTLVETVHIPGRLFSVGPDAARNIPHLFARNERLVCHFDTSFGPMAQVMVGAMLVSGVETIWGGVEIPEYARQITRKDYRGRGITVDRFAEMGRFNYGSTVITLLPPKVATLAAQLSAGSVVRLGQRLALLR